MQRLPPWKTIALLTLAHWLLVVAVFILRVVLRGPTPTPHVPGVPATDFLAIALRVLLFPLVEEAIRSKIQLPIGGLTLIGALNGVLWAVVIFFIWQKMHTYRVPNG
jgi:ABC-type Fe3+-siderophore transport system permease subunit